MNYENIQRVSNVQELLQLVKLNNYTGEYAVNAFPVQYEKLNDDNAIRVTFPTENLQITIADDATMFSLIDSNGPTDIFTEFDFLPFYNEKVIIDEGITAIKTINDFEECEPPTISEIHLPSTIKMNPKEVDYSFFAHTQNITVDENNPNFSSIDGVLFSKDGTKLLKYPDANERTTYTVPDSVKTIAAFSFVTCENLSELTIPNNVTFIEANAFSHCENLADVTIPKYIEDTCAFYNCSEFARHTTTQSLDDILNSFDVAKPNNIVEPIPINNDDISI